MCASYPALAYAPMWLHSGTERCWACECDLKNDAQRTPDSAVQCFQKQHGEVGGCTPG